MAFLNNVWIWHRNCGHERLGVRVKRAQVNFISVRQFHNLAQIHDRYSIADMPNHAQVVGDEQISQTQLLSCNSSNRLTTCAWMETSREEIGSSHIIRSGLTARARAMPMRCRCPPENSCG